MITTVQREGKGGGELSDAGVMRKRGRGGADLCRTVQDAPDEVDQLLHGADGLAGQEVLLVGGVEDDHGGHRHFSEGGGGDAGLHRAFGLASVDRNTLQTTVVNKAFGL